MALGKRTKKTGRFVPPKLMLTSMMDMFTIILIFLLFSFSENPETLTIDKNLELPSSSTEMDYQDTVKIVLSKKELRLNEELVATVDHSRISGMARDDLASSALFQRLKARRQAQQEKTGGPDQAPHILFLCDQSHSFKTINQVIKTAGLAGFPNFQFGVLEEK